MYEEERNVSEFISFYKVNERYHGNERALVLTYYAFTSLSTVGLGDYRPRNSFERLGCVIVLLFGNAIFGYIIGCFNEMVQEVKNFNGEEYGQDDLNRFFNLLSRFNYNNQLPENLRNRIE